MNTPHTIHLYRILKTTVREFFEENKTTDSPTENTGVRFL